MEAPIDDQSDTGAFPLFVERQVLLDGKVARGEVPAEYAPGTNCPVSFPEKEVINA